MHHLRTSHSQWNFSLRKPRSKRKHLQKTNPPYDQNCPETRGSIASSEYPDIWSDAIEDQKDGFYRYSESLIEEEKRQASLKLTQQQESPDQSTVSSSFGIPVIVEDPYDNSDVFFLDVF